LNGGEKTYLDLEIVNDRLVVAIRPLVEFLGGRVDWHADSLTVRCELP